MSTPNHPSLSHVDSKLGQILAFIILFEKKVLSFSFSRLSNFESSLLVIKSSIVDLPSNFLIRDAKAISLQKIFLMPSIDLLLQNRLSTLRLFVRSTHQMEPFLMTSSFLIDFRFIKFLTPKTNKILAQRFMIRTYRQGALLPSNIIALLLEAFSTAITMVNVT